MPPSPDPRLAALLDHLTAAVLLTSADRERVERAAAVSGTRVDRALRELGLVSDAVLAEAVAGRHRAS